MNPIATAECVAMIYAAAGRKPDPVVAATWENSLSDLRDDEGRAAAAAIASRIHADDRLPTPADLRAEVQRLRRHTELAAPRRCELCDGTGWVEVSHPPLVVERCRCNSRRTEHPSGCTCHVCAGVVEWRPRISDDERPAGAPDVARLRDVLSGLIKEA